MAISFMQRYVCPCSTAHIVITDMVDRFTMWSWHLNPGPDKVEAINILRANNDEYPIVT